MDRITTIYNEDHHTDLSVDTQTQHFRNNAHDHCKFGICRGGGLLFSDGRNNSTAYYTQDTIELNLHECMTIHTYVLYVFIFELTNPPGMREDAPVVKISSNGTN